MESIDVNLETDRLLIRYLSLDDAEVFFGYRSHPSICKFQNWFPKSLQDAKDFIEKNQKDGWGKPSSWFEIGLEEKKSGRLIGDLGIHFLESGNPQCEIGFTLDPTHQGKGFGTEAVVRLVTYLFVELKKHRITASVDPENPKSIRLLERVGFKKEAHFKKSLFFKGEWVDDVIYAVLNEDWHKSGSSSV